MILIAILWQSFTLYHHSVVLGLSKSNTFRDDSAASRETIGPFRYAPARCSYTNRRTTKCTIIDNREEVYFNLMAHVRSIWASSGVRCSKCKASLLPVRLISSARRGWVSNQQRQIRKNLAAKKLMFLDGFG
jgi:hypothetical protein